MPMRVNENCITDAKGVFCRWFTLETEWNKSYNISTVNITTLTSFNMLHWT
jgi:hypothetical protein